MKKILRIFWALGLSAVVAVALSSCKDENPQGGNDGGVITDPTEFPEPLDHSNIIYPINYEPYTVEKGRAGVSIEVTEVSMTDFTFVCRPGSTVQSYKVCAFPLSTVYNYLINLDWTAGITAEAVEEILRSYIHEISGSPVDGYIGGADVVYNIEGNTDNEKTFVWSESGYTYVPPIVPDSEYLIVALAYYEKNATTQADISLCYLRTASHTRDGNPSVESVSRALYGAVELNYIRGNEEAVAFYEFTGVKSEILAYIEQFGERMFVDYLRNMMIGDPYPFEGTAFPFPFIVRMTEEQAADALSAAVAVDRYGMPGDLHTWDVTIKPIPEGVAQGKATVTVDQEHIGSLVFWLTAEMDEATYSVNINQMTAAQAETYKNDSEARAELKEALIEEGWVIQNPNFKFDEDLELPTGEGSTQMAYRIDMKDILPNTEYVVAYVATNYFTQAEDVYFTEPFTTKSRNITEPSSFSGRFSVDIDDADSDKASPIGFTIKFTYDPDEVAAYYWQVVSPTDNGQSLPDGGAQIPGFQGAGLPLADGITHAQWMKYFFEGVDIFGNPLCNIWFYNWDDLESAGNNGTTVDNGDGTVTDRWTFADMIPGTSYEVVAAPEDWNGNVGEVNLYVGQTTTLNPGKNPVASIVAQLNSGGGFSAVVEMNDEVGRLLIMQATTSSELNASWSPAQLVSGQLKGGLLTAEDLEASIRQTAIDNGLSYYTDTPWSYTETAPCIFICVPEGDNCYGETEYVIYDGQKLSYDVRDYL